MCLTVIAPLHSEKTNTSREPYISTNREVLECLSTHAIFLLHGITRWPDTAKNPQGAEKKKIPDLWLRSKTGGGVGCLEAEGPETEKGCGTVGEWPFTRQLFSLRCLFSANFLSNQSLFGPVGSTTGRGECLMWQEVLHSEEKPGTCLGLYRAENILWCCFNPSFLQLY